MAMRAYRFFKTSIRRKNAEPTDDEEVSSEDKNARTKCQRFGKKFLMFMFSHVGLTGLVVGYAILGGVIFMKLESPYEIKEKTVVGSIRSDYVQRLWFATKKLNILHKPNWTSIADKILKEFQLEVFKAVKEKGWDGSEGESTSDLQWTYAGALLYAVTIITTIGYGHIAPKTLWGRIATIIYALIGIPLTLLCLANIGGALGKCFRFLYSRIICGLCRHWKRRKALRLATANTPDGIQIHAKKSCCRQQKSGCGCCGRNKKTKCKNENKNYVAEPVDTIVTYQPTEEDEYGPDEVVRVPVIVTMGIMAGYIFGGAMLFTLWEKDWSFLVGSYFCFITLSTIGFGDFVPGTSLQSWASQEKRLLCSLYLLFGLALLAMCFDLMQEQVRYTCRRIGMWIGIVESPKL